MIEIVQRLLFGEDMSDVVIAPMDDQRTIYYDVGKGTIYRIRIETNTTQIIKIMHDENDRPRTKWVIESEWNEDKFKRLLAILESE